MKLYIFALVACVSSQTIFRSPSLLDQLYGELHGRTNTAPNLQVQAEDPNQMATQKVLAMRSKLTLPDKDDTPILLLIRICLVES